MKLKTKFWYFLFPTVFLFFANIASAALVNCGGTGQSPCEIKDIVWLIARIINFLLASAWFIALFMILWSAFTLLGASGNEEEVTAGKETLRHAIIGFFLIMIAYLLINWLLFALIGGKGTSVSNENGAFDYIFNLIKP